MRILQINAVYGDGSTGKIVEDLHNISRDVGIESYVAYSTTSKSDISNGYIIGNYFEKKIHALMTRMSGKQGYYSLAATKKLVKYIEELKPDIVHLHNLHSNFVHLNTLLSYLAKADISTILTLHDCWFYTGGCFHYSAVSCDKWQKACGKCPRQKGEDIRFLIDSSASILADRKSFFGDIKKLYIVGVSKWIENEARKSVLHPRLFTHIYNGVNTDFFKPVPSDFREKYGLNGKFLILGMANKFFQPVNKETLEYIAGSLQNDECLVLVGCNDKQRKRLPSRVLGIQYINDREELRAIYSACDVFVNCTREDSFPLVTLEVQACGTPVVTYSNTGVKETVDGDSSYAVESGKPEKLLEKIRKIRTENYQRRSKKCIEWIRDNFEVNDNYKNYIELYRCVYQDAENYKNC